MEYLEKVIRSIVCLNILRKLDSMKIYLIGTGMGSKGTLTEKGRELINKADLIIGSERMTDIAGSDKRIFNEYRADEIARYLKNLNADVVCILLSGDVGFYSGAKKLISALSAYDLELIPGISSVVYFCSAVKTDWQDIKLLSLHGKEANALMYIKRYKKVFMLLSGNENIRELCSKLCMYGMGDVMLHIGQRLSYEDEKITSTRARDIKEFNFDSLSVLIAENERAEDNSMRCIGDDEFIRGRVPMTKSEIRTLSIMKLNLKPNSILYDVGAGTGSVSVEASEKLIDGKIFAIEKNEEALSLIEKNKIKFAADNINIVSGTAPEAFEKLPPPTHMFIGGSAGNMEEIINCALRKNPNVKIVINAIALNTVGEAAGIINKHGFKADIASVTVAKNRQAGNYQLMVGNNPVYIIVLN